MFFFSNTLFITYQNGSKLQVFIHKKISKTKILCGNFYRANIVEFYSFLIQVEIKKKCY
jgi:hypothetical protein